MADNKPHLIVNNFFTAEQFRSKRLGRSDVFPLQDRLAHGQNLDRQYSQVLSSYDQLSEQQTQTSITQETGIYVEITSIDNISLPIDKLDNTNFELRSCTQIGTQEVALIFIKDSKRTVFSKKIEEYLGSSPLT